MVLFRMLRFLADFTFIAVTASVFLFGVVLVMLFAFILQVHCFNFLFFVFLMRQIYFNTIVIIFCNSIDNDRLRPFVFRFIFFFLRIISLIQIDTFLVGGSGKCNSLPTRLLLHSFYIFNFAVRSGLVLSQFGIGLELFTFQRLFKSHWHLTFLDIGRLRPSRLFSGWFLASRSARSIRSGPRPWSVTFRIASTRSSRSRRSVQLQLSYLLVSSLQVLRQLTSQITSQL